MLTSEQVRDLANRQEAGENIVDDEEIFQQLYEFFLPEMPYGTAKARTGDPHAWMWNRLNVNRELTVDV